MSFLTIINSCMERATKYRQQVVAVEVRALSELLHHYHRMDAILREQYKEAEANRVLSTNRSTGVHWLIKTSDETEHYVSRIDNIQFSPGIENAKELTLAELANTLGQLAIMQRQSSWKPSDYTMICVKE